MYGVMLYHNNPRAIYRDEWIEACLRSIGEQTYRNFHVIEVDYGDVGNQLYPGSEYIREPMPTFVHAVNSLLDLGRDRGYKGMFNVHLDDVFDRRRFELQVAALRDYDIVSSNFYATDLGGNVVRAYQFDQLDPELEMARGHNILCNPVIAYSQRFLEEGVRYRPEECPEEDFECWKRNAGTMKFVVLPEMLCYKRMHPNEASNSEHR